MYEVCADGVGGVGVVEVCLWMVRWRFVVVGDVGGEFV